MQKVVLRYGLLGGLIVTASMIISTVAHYDNPDMTFSMIVGVVGMLVAFSTQFFAVKNYRDKVNGGSVSFGKGFKIALLVGLIISTIYVAVWLVEFYAFMPDFMEKYAAHELASAQKAGKSAEEIQKMATEMNRSKEMYKTPLGVIALTYMEILPIGVVLALIAALVMKRKVRTTPSAA